VSGYTQGRDVEYDVIHHLQENGYDTVRGASSKGLADVVAIKPGQILIVNVKRTKPPGPAERVNLLRVAGHLPCALPLVALGRPRLAFRLLTGPGPAEWVPWTADELDPIGVPHA
jgi:holliday junction resolvase Hjr